MTTVLVTGGRFYAEPLVHGQKEFAIGRVTFDGPLHRAMSLVAEDGDRIRRETVFLFRTLDKFHEKIGIDHLIHGGASGADKWAQAWAEMRGIKETSFPADWKTHGKAAGPIRNRQMLEVGRPDLVIAFPGGRGTADMLRAAKDAGVRVWKPAPETA